MVYLPSASLAINLEHYISLHHLRIWSVLYCLYSAMAESHRTHVQYLTALFVFIPPECVRYINHHNCCVCFQYPDRELIALIFRYLHFR